MHIDIIHHITHISYLIYHIIIPFFDIYIMSITPSLRYRWHYQSRHALIHSLLVSSSIDYTKKRRVSHIIYLSLPRLPQAGAHVFTHRWSEDTFTLLEWITLHPLLPLLSMGRWKEFLTLKNHELILALNYRHNIHSVRRERAQCIVRKGGQRFSRG